MARRGFRIHSSAVFDPFSYQEMLAPLMQAQTAYDQMQDNMLTLGEEANTYKQLIDTDPEASKTLQSYNDTLESMANQLSTQGLKAVNRNSLLNLRRRYNRDVKPINDAAKTLAGLQDMYRNAYAKDQTLMKGAMPTISELVANPGAMPHMVSGTDLYKQGAQAAQSASARINETDFGNRINGYIQQVATQGYSPELVASFLQDVSAIPDLANSIQSIRDMYKTNNLEDRGYQADKFIMQGILDGITYQKKENYVQDWQAHMATQYAYQQKAADAAAQRQANLETLKATLKGGKPGSGSGVDYNTRLKGAWYVKDGKEYDQSTLSQSALEEAMKDSNMITVAPSELTPENKLRALKVIGIDTLDLMDYAGNINEGLVDEVFEQYAPYINSQYVLRQAKITGKRDEEGHRIPRKQRIESDEFLMVPLDVKREADNAYLGGTYNNDDDITF